MSWKLHRKLLVVAAALLSFTSIARPITQSATTTPPAPQAGGATTITGTVVDAALTPLSGVAVMLERAGRVVQKTTSAADGRFRFISVAPGDYRVRAVVTPLDADGTDTLNGLCGIIAYYMNAESYIALVLDRDRQMKLLQRRGQRFHVLLLDELPAAVPEERLEDDPHREGQRENVGRHLLVQLLQAVNLYVTGACCEARACAEGIVVMHAPCLSDCR